MTAAIIVAAISAVAAIVAAFISSHNGGKLNEVRVIINGRLDKLIEENKELSKLLTKKEEELKNGNTSPKN